MIPPLDKILDDSGKTHPIRLYAAASEAEPEEILDALKMADGTALVAAIHLAPVVAGRGLTLPIAESLLDLIDLDNRFEWHGRPFDLGSLAGEKLLALLVSAIARSGESEELGRVFAGAFEKMIEHGLTGDLCAARPMATFRDSLDGEMVGYRDEIERLLWRTMENRSANAEARYGAWSASDGPSSAEWSRTVLLDETEDGGLRALIGRAILKRDPSFASGLIQGSAGSWKLAAAARKDLPISAPREMAPDEWHASTIALAAHRRLRDDSIRELGRRTLDEKRGGCAEKKDYLVSLERSQGTGFRRALRAASHESGEDLNGGLHAAALMIILGDPHDEPHIAAAIARTNPATILDFNRSESSRLDRRDREALESGVDAAWASLSPLIVDSRGESDRRRILAQVYTELAGRFLDAHRRDRAIAMYQKALAIDPNHFVARKGLRDCGRKST